VEPSSGSDTVCGSSGNRNQTVLADAARSIERKKKKKNNCPRTLEVGPCGREIANRKSQGVFFRDVQFVACRALWNEKSLILGDKTQGTVGCSTSAG
jgi:hypothetical protein